MATILFRADASTQIGAGHVMRCLALAQALSQSKHYIVFAGDFPEGLRRRIEAEQYQVEAIDSRLDPLDTAALARGLAADWVVFDGYRFGSEYQRKLKQTGRRVLAVDDYVQAEHYWADIVLNQNAYARAESYQAKEVSTRLLMGSRYAMLRREFWGWQDWARSIPAVAKKVLVTYGGSDPFDLTLRTVRALEGVEVEAVRAVVGSSYPYVENLRQSSQAEVLVNVSDMPEQLAWADLAVAASGSTTWESCLMGLPTILVSWAENQKSIGEAVDKIGAARYVGWHEDVDQSRLLLEIQTMVAEEDQRRSMSRAGQALVDGFGAHRVAHAMLGQGLFLREASARDGELLLRWANEPAVRAASLSEEPIEKERHGLWLARKLKACQGCILIGENEFNEPVGQVQFEISGSSAEIEMSIDAAHRGKGYASQMLAKACESIRPEITRLLAHIKLDNEPSLNAFTRAGFTRLPDVTLRGVQVAELELRR